MIVTKGATDVTTYVMLVDSAAGTPETGYTIANLDLQYTRNRETPAAKVDATALAATNTAHTDNYAIQIDATSSPGLYRVDWPDAAFATGADKVILVVSGTGLAPAVLHVELVNYNTQDGVRMGLTALPNAAADAAGGLIISDAGGLDADAQRTDVAAILVDTGTTLDGRIPAALVSGRMDSTVDGTGMETGAISAILTTAITEAYRANAAAPTLAQFMSEVLAHLGEAAISGTTKTINKLDHATAAATFTLDSATAPTTITRAT